MRMTRIIPTEDQEQTKLATWLTLRRIRFFSIPNGANKSFNQGAKFKRTGLQAGVPDLCIPIPSGSYHGCYIELKRVSGGTLSDHQIEWLNFLRKQGYFADVARGADEAIAMVQEYLAMTPRAA